MKKQVLTLAVCLALTATMASASGTDATTKPLTSRANIATVKPQISPVGFSGITNPNQAKLMTRADGRKMFEDRKTKERTLMYNALSLS